MQRRDFLKMLSGLGLGLAYPFDLKANTSSILSGYRGGDVFYMDIFASGGLDSTLFSDPKSGDCTDPYPDDDEEPNKGIINPCYNESEITNAGNILYPNIRAEYANGDATTAIDWSEFFAKFYKKITIINGIDPGTTSHLFGMKETGGGMLTRKYAALPALHAATQNALKGGVVMPFLSVGTQYDVEDGLISKATLSSSEYDKLLRLAEPNRVDPTAASDTPEFQERFYEDNAYMAIMNAAQNRLDRKIQGSRHLPRTQKNTQNLYVGRLGNEALKRIVERYNDRPGITGVTNESIKLKKTIRMALCAYKEGACYAASLQHGGFDSHNDYATKHKEKMGELLDGLIFLFKEAGDLGILNRIAFRLSTEFSRFPWLNDGEGTGKGHWGAGANSVIYHPDLMGNRVVGMTDADAWYSAKFNGAGDLGFQYDTPATQAVTDNIGSEYNNPITQLGVHQEMRALLQIDAGFCAKYPLADWSYKMLRKRPYKSEQSGLTDQAPAPE
ncbi:MAG: DUF1501 domain-containing protein [Myxococcota bacterium]|nr:DUF1501 domain-containing protein [Myxococcota bacterium]